MLNYRGLNIIVAKKKVKRISIRIVDGQLKASVPFNYQEAKLKELIDDHYDWIIKKLENKRIAVSYADPIYLLGVKYELKESISTNPKVQLEDDKIFIAGKSEAIRKKVFDGVCERVLLDVFSNLKQYNVKINFKNYKSKWGCCNPSKKEITFNYRLASLPFEAIEYVYYHEIAHLKVKNHQKEFYQEVERLLPNYKVGLKITKKYTI